MRDPNEQEEVFTCFVSSFYACVSPSFGFLTGLQVGFLKSPDGRSQVQQGSWRDRGRIASKDL